MARELSDRCSTPEFVKKSGNVYGAIEIGSKGIKAAIIQELDKLNDEVFKYVARDDKDGIDSRNVNAINPATKDDTVKAVAAVSKEMQERFSISCEQIVIYSSSGLAKKALRSLPQTRKNPPSSQRSAMPSNSNPRYLIPPAST